MFNSNGPDSVFIVHIIEPTNKGIDRPTIYLGIYRKNPAVIVKEMQKIYTVNRIFVSVVTTLTDIRYFSMNTERGVRAKETSAVYYLNGHRNM